MVAALPYDGVKADIWSCGIIFFAMITGTLPFDDPNQVKIFEKIIREQYEIPSYLSGQCQDLIRKLLHRDPKSRITVQGIRKHAFSRIMRFYRKSSMQKFEKRSDYFLFAI